MSSKLRVGVAGPVGSGKTALLETLCLSLKKNYEIAVVTNDIYTKEDANFLINKKVLELSLENEKYDKGDYKHFMAKEIEEQPTTLKNGINEYVDTLNNDINIYNFPWKTNEISSVTLIGCGTAYHSCLLAKYWFEELTSLDVNVDIASEFRYRKNRFKKEALYIFVSQSGETADTYAALDLCNQNDMKTCAVVNVIESSIARDSKFVLPIHCGTEIGVASTKAFLGQILILYILALKIGLNFSMMKFWDKDLFNYAQSKSYLLIPGINNLKDLKEAINLNCNIIKIYPIKSKDSLIDILNYKNIDFIAAGGLSINDLKTYKSLGYKAIVIGDKGIIKKKY